VGKGKREGRGWGGGGGGPSHLLRNKNKELSSAIDTSEEGRKEKKRGVESHAREAGLQLAMPGGKGEKRGGEGGGVSRGLAHLSATGRRSLVVYARRKGGERGLFYLRTGEMITVYRKR